MYVSEMTAQENKLFLDYCMAFYGKDGIYELEFTEAEIVLAMELYKLQLARYNEEFCSDTIDRERVRDIVLKSREFFGKSA